MMKPKSEMEYKGYLGSVDDYLNKQVANKEEILVEHWLDIEALRSRGRRMTYRNTRPSIPSGKSWTTCTQ